MGGDGGCTGYVMATNGIPDVDLEEIQRLQK